jgi:hypothetical protein
MNDLKAQSGRKSTLSRHSEGSNQIVNVDRNSLRKVKYLDKMGRNNSSD